VSPEVGLLHKHPAAVLVGTVVLLGALAARVRLQVTIQFLLAGEMLCTTLKVKAQEKIVKIRSATLFLSLEEK